MIGDAFFPAESPVGRLLSVLATFGVGFVTRPLGAAIIDPCVDRAGRRAALTLTLLLMSFGSAIIALTPHSESTGDAGAAAGCGPPRAFFDFCVVRSVRL
jgi:MFS transporter, MHS family, proline/betaine transporter